MSLDRWHARAIAINSLLCVGLDSDFERIPARFRASDHPQYDFNRWIIEQTHEVASAYKPNMAFYEARGARGWADLALTLDYLRAHVPDAFTICDAKRGDIGSTNAGYVRAIFDELGFDAITLHPYLGAEALAPFLERADKTCIILCRTSNPASAELQNLLIDGVPLWQVIAERVRDHWNARGNCMLVVGATYPDELRQVRALIPAMPLLIPGVGAQGGDLTATLAAGLDADHSGLVINSGRAIIFADDPRAAARDLHNAINQHRR